MGYTVVIFPPLCESRSMIWRDCIDCSNRSTAVARGVYVFRMGENVDDDGWSRNAEPATLTGGTYFPYPPITRPSYRLGRTLAMDQAIAKKTLQELIKREDLKNKARRTSLYQNDALKLTTSNVDLRGLQQPKSSVGLRQVRCIGSSNNIRPYGV